MRGTGQSRVIRTYGGFYEVQSSLIILPVLDHHLRRLLDRHVDGSLVVSGSHNEVYASD